MTLVIISVVMLFASPALCLDTSLDPQCASVGELGGDQLITACSEAQVEAFEGDLAETMVVELLQRDLKHSRMPSGKAIQADIKVDEDESGDRVTIPSVRGKMNDPEENETEQETSGQLQPQVFQPTASEQNHEVNSSSMAQVGANSSENAAEVDESPTVDCAQYPAFCDPRVNCADNPATAADQAEWDKRLATKDGHANLRTWCMVYPMYATSVSKCIIEDSKEEYARIMYEDQKQAGLTDADAVYCFVSGHCNNTDVRANTTLQETEEICDKKYGREKWTSVGWSDFMGVVSRAKENVDDSKKSLSEGRTSWSDLLKLARNESEISAMTSCAMGNYQCDVFYCKVNYCRNENLRRQYGNLSWAVA